MPRAICADAFDDDMLLLLLMARGMRGVIYAVYRRHVGAPINDTVYISFTTPRRLPLIIAVITLVELDVICDIADVTLHSSPTP